MPTFFAKKATAPAFMPVNGGAVSLVDSFRPAANFTAADVVNLVRIPAGTEVSVVQVQGDDLDTNGSPTIVFRLGYAPCNAGSALAAVDNYFAAAGQTTLQAGGRLNCAFKPIKFEEDVWLTMTVNTASATFAAGDIFGIVLGAAVGPK
jgi:hypothetical protein